MNINHCRCFRNIKGFLDCISIQTTTQIGNQNKIIQFYKQGQALNTENNKELKKDFNFI